MVTLLMSQDALGSYVMLAHAPDPAVTHPKLPPAAKLMDVFVGARDGPRELDS